MKSRHAAAPEVDFKSHFLDSGAHSLYNQKVDNDPEKRVAPGRGDYGWYDTRAFRKYLDRYAAFVKDGANAIAIDHYANVDVIYDPARTWKAQQYLENEHGLRPVPVVHWNTPLRWVDKYLEAGHTYLGVGGLGQGVSRRQYYAWADGLFDHLCPKTNGRLPRVRTHGFAMTSLDLMVRYPWFSVDSATWTKVGAYGGVMVPAAHADGGWRFVFDHRGRKHAAQPWVAGFSEKSSEMRGREDLTKNFGTRRGVLRCKHYTNLSADGRRRLEEWLAAVGVPLGETASDGTVVTHGVVNRHSERKMANLLFFERLLKELPVYPWAFAPARVGGSFGLGA